MDTHSLDLHPDHNNLSAEEPLVTAKSVQNYEQHDRLHSEFNPKSQSSVYNLRKTWVNRTFSNWSTSSLKVSVLSSICVALGTGVMALPKAMAYAGLVGGGILIFIGCMLNMFSHYLLSYCQSLNPQQDVYIGIIEFCVGRVKFYFKF